MEVIIAIRLKSSALFFALLVSIIIATLCTALISLTYFNKKINADNFLKERLTENVESALVLAVHKKSDKPDFKLFDLYGDGTDSVKISRMLWGFFDIAYAEAFQQTENGKQKNYKTCLVGQEVPVINNSTALYLADRKTPLFLYGQTQIIGSTYLPAEGVKGGIIDGKGYEGNKLIQGTIANSSTQLPQPDLERNKNILEMFNINANTSLSLIQNSQYHSFDQIKHVFRAKNLNLSGLKLKGNICLIADSAIYIASNSILEDVILCAPDIKIEDGFTGSIQAFANKNLICGKNVRLNYPSVLALFKSENAYSAPECIIETNSIIEGLVYIYNSGSDQNPPNLKIEKNTVIIGSLYADAVTQLQGKIFGSAFCRNFIYKTSSGIYDNYLADAIINANALPYYFVSPIYKTSTHPNKIVKWLH